MHGTTLPALTGQVQPSLGELAKAIRAEHAAVVSALSGAVEHAIRCGNILADAKKQTGHGCWLDFLRACEIGERTAQQYMQLAHLAGQNRTRGTDLAGQNGTDLAGMTIKGAIRHLAPPKSAKPEKSPIAGAASKQVAGPKSPTGNPGKRVAHVDIIEVWLAASVEARRQAIDGIGLNAYLAAIPESWWPLIEKRLAERSAPPPPVATLDPALLPADGSIPPCLRRTAKKPKPQGDAAASAATMKARFAALDAGAA
jgi:hypothetical protein